jgi:hypothetical protein
MISGCIIYLHYSLSHGPWLPGLSHTIDRCKVGARDVDGPRVLWKFGQLIHLVSNLDIPPSGNPTGMASVIIPFAYLIVIFGGLYVFSVFYRRHIAGKSTLITLARGARLRSNALDFSTHSKAGRPVLRLTSGKRCLRHSVAAGSSSTGSHVEGCPRATCHCRRLSSRSFPRGQTCASEPVAERFSGR